MVYLARGIMPTTLSEWLTLLAFLIIVSLLFYLVTKDSGRYNRIKKMFISKSKIREFDCEIFLKEHRSEGQNHLNLSNRPSVGAKNTSSINMKSDFYIVTFKGKDRSISLQVDEREYTKLKEDRKGTLKYYRSTFISFTPEQ